MKKEQKISKNFVLDKKITSLKQFVEVIETQPSIFCRHRINSTAFYWGWNIRIINDGIKKGIFWTVKKIEL